MVPAYGGLIARYDTHATFTTGTSWSVFDTMSLNAGARGYIGATFDGRYIWLAPYFDNTAIDGLVPRYDTQGTGFNVAGSWSTFDTTTVNANSKGFQGAGFDGEYMYLVPSNNGTVPTGEITRFDTKTPSWLPRDWNSAFN